MAKLTLTDPTAGYNSTTVIAANNTLVEAALENTLSRDGTGPNQMEAQLDMNSYKIVNCLDAVNNQSPITLAQAASLASITTSLSQENVGAVLYPATADETSAGVTPTNYYYPPLDVRRYGALGDGATDDSTAIQAALDIANTAGGGVVTLQADTYIVSTGLTVYGGTILRGSGSGNYFSTFASNTGTIIRSDASITAVVTTDENSGTAGNAILEDLTIDGADLATNGVLMQGIKDTLRRVHVVKGLTYGVHQNVTGVGEQNILDTTITMNSKGTGLYVEAGSDNNYVNVIVHGAYTAALLETGGHQFTNFHPYPSPLDPGDASHVCLLDIAGTSDNYFVNCHFDQVHTSGQYQVRIRTHTTGGSALENTFIGCSFDNPDADIDNVVSGVYMDASAGSNKWVTANFYGCNFSGNGTYKYQYAFEKEATGKARVVYNVYGGLANNVTALWSDRPNNTIGFQLVSGGITLGVGGGTTVNGPLATTSGGELTIATGAITVTDSHHRLDTESDAASDDLDTINGGFDGMILVLQGQNSARDVTVKDGTGNLALNDDFTLSNDQATITLQYHLAQTEWVELARTPGATNVAYTPTNVSTDRAFDADTVAVAELADVVGTLIADLQNRGVIG